MASEPGHPGKQAYDRWFLLSERRNELLALWEVQQYGHDSFGDPDHVTIYGLKPPQWYARGVRILGRTAVECTPDRLADLIGRDVAAVARAAPAASPMAVDLFAGSGNTHAHESVEAGSLAEVTARFPWSALKVYDINAPGQQNPGLLLATWGWAPP